MDQKEKTTHSQLRIRITAMLFSLLIGSALLFAHGAMQHVMGTVAKVENGVLTIKTVKGAIVDVKLDSKTEFSKGDQKANVGDLKPGDRIVVHAMKEKGGGLLAHSGKLGGASSMDNMKGMEGMKDMEH